MELVRTIRGRPPLCLSLSAPACVYLGTFLDSSWRHLKCRPSNITRLLESAERWSCRRFGSWSPPFRERSRCKGRTKGRGGRRRSQDTLSASDIATLFGIRYEIGFVTSIECLLRVDRERIRGLAVRKSGVLDSTLLLPFFWRDPVTR